MPEEQPKVGNSNLADIYNLQVTPNDSTLKNTKGSSPENPEATGQESVNKTVNNNPSSQRYEIQQSSEPAQRIINIVMAEISKSTADDVQGEILCLQEMFTNYSVLPE